MNADKLNAWGAAPEMLLLAVAGLVMLLDLFIGARRRGVVLAVALVGLLLVAVLCGQGLAQDAVGYAFNGMYVADPMANLLKIVACICAAATMLYSEAYGRDRAMWHGELFTLTLFATLGILVMISANNLLVIYLGLELQALSLYALAALRRDESRATEAAMKYFVLGAMASGFLLYGMSMLYGATGTLDINELAHRIASGRVPGIGAVALGTVFVVAGLAFKLGAVPFHMWVPDVYHGAPTPVTMLIGSAPKLGAFAMSVRLLVEGLSPVASDWGQMVTVLAVGSLVVGNVTAIAQTNLKRMLGYSTIAQMGFMLLAMRAGLGAGSTAATAASWSAALFYVVTYALTTLGTFGIILLLSRQGFESEEIADLRGLNRRSPWYAFVMLVLMFSLAGVPPAVGFYAKLVVLQALIEGGGVPGIVLAVFAVLFSLVGAFYYLRVVKTMYFDEPADGSPIVATQATRVALSLNAVTVLVLGLLPQYLLGLCGAAMLRTLGG